MEIVRFCEHNMKRKYNATPGNAIDNPETE